MPFTFRCSQLPDNVAKFRQFESETHTNTTYAAMTAEMDQGVGRILDALDDLGIAENTYVIFGLG